MSNETRFPLAWPNGWARAKHRGAALFRDYGKRISIDTALRRLQRELDLLKASAPVCSTNCETRLDGSIRGDRRPPTDPGVAVYFTLNKRRLVLACDRWDRVADNIAAIAAHVEALRGQERWGVGTIEQAFFGYQSLEDFSTGVPWRRVLGCKPGDDWTLEIAELAYRELAKEAHPDRTKDDGVQMARLNEAIAAARKEFKG